MNIEPCDDVVLLVLDACDTSSVSADSLGEESGGDMPMAGWDTPDGSWNARVCS
jgi:hypothetical protein